MATKDIKEKITKKSPGRPKVVKKVAEDVEIVKEEKKAPEAPVLKIERKAGREGKYVYAIGRRKSAKAQVRLMETGTGKITINGKELSKYFDYFVLQNTVLAPLKAVQEESIHDVSAVVLGGGALGQAEAIRLGISRALVEWNEALKPVLKKMGFITRDPRVKERKKFGLKKARRAPQWSKR